jgi:hypothetical protein
VKQFSNYLTVLFVCVLAVLNVTWCGRKEANRKLQLVKEYIDSGERDGLKKAAAIFCDLVESGEYKFLESNDQVLVKGMACLALAGKRDDLGVKLDFVKAVKLAKELQNSGALAEDSKLIAGPGVDDLRSLIKNGCLRYK